MSSARNGSTALQCFECGNAFAIRKGIMFDFYPGLPHMIVFSYSRAVQSYDIAQMWVLLHRPWGTLNDILAINMLLLELIHLKGEKKHGTAVVS